MRHFYTSTLPSDRALLSLRQLLVLFPSSTMKCLFSNMLSINSVRWISLVISSTFWRRRLWVTVSYAAERSTKTTPVTFPSSKPSSIYWVRLSTWLVVDLPGRKPTCSRMSKLSITGPIRFSMSHSNNLYVWHSSDIGRKFFGTDGSLPGFRSAITWAFFQILGSLWVARQWLYN